MGLRGANRELFRLIIRKLLNWTQILKKRRETENFRKAIFVSVSFSVTSSLIFQFNGNSGVKRHQTNY